MFGSSLRSRLFQAIGVVVIICVALTIGLGLVLTRRAVEKATLQDVENQADIIAAIQSGGAERVTVTPAGEKLVNTKHLPTIVPIAARAGLLSKLTTRRKGRSR